MCANNTFLIDTNIWTSYNFYVMNNYNHLQIWRVKKHSFDINAILVHWSLFADPQTGATLRDDLRRISGARTYGNWKRNKRNMWDISLYTIPNIVFLVTLFFLLAFWARPSSAQDAFLFLTSGITMVVLREPYVVSEIEPISAVCMASTLPTVLFFQEPSNISNLWELLPLIWVQPALHWVPP